MLDSGFLPIGACGETYLRLDLDSDAEIGEPPQAPQDWRLEERASGVVRVYGFYYQAIDDANRADEWSIGYTTDGSTPAADSPTATVVPGRSNPGPRGCALERIARACAERRDNCGSASSAP